MLDITIIIIQKFAYLFGLILNTPIYWTNDQYIYVYDVVIYIALIFLFIKLFGIVTNNSVVSKKG